MDGARPVTREIRFSAPHVYKGPNYHNFFKLKDYLAHSLPKLPGQTSTQASRPPPGHTVWPRSASEATQFKYLSCMQRSSKSSLNKKDK
jgi:hypothetical protein